MSPTSTPDVGIARRNVGLELLVVSCTVSLLVVNITGASLVPLMVMSSVVVAVPPRPSDTV